jgi:hypothetical protein
VSSHLIGNILLHVYSFRDSFFIVLGVSKIPQLFSNIIPENIRNKYIVTFLGVPVSTQWESQGYYYTTQIAQFGLSHYSKNLTEPDPRRTLLEDAERDLLAHWVVPDGASVSRILDAHTGSHVMQFSSPGV